MLGTVASYQLIAKDIGRSLAELGNRAEIKRDVSYFLANIRKVKSAEEFIKDDRLFSFAMTAFGLKDMIYAKAFMRKVLAEGVEGEKSFALQLADSRFQEFAETFNFARYGATATAFDRAQQGTVDRYMRARLEAEAGGKDEGVRLALYFARKAPAVTSTFGLMADTALYKVVQAALGLPQAFSGVDIDRQAAVISAKLDVNDFKEPAKLEKFITRFTSRWQAEHDRAVVPNVAIGPGLLSSFDNGLLLSMQTLKRGR